ncbi:DEAD/DEAH box helicase [Trueperella pyogenes]|uniref:DEAD/DEAH box helicase n=1 Tax=Trueperella pyogenes TaxID=1661 RepID=UPI003C7DF062
MTSLATARSRPTALYLSPTKALGADQENSLSKLAALVDPHIGIATVDGDADGPTRSWARQSADIVLTNPDFAHFGLLGRHEMWQRLWRGLQFIVVDEFHSYRGAFRCQRRADSAQAIARSSPLRRRPADYFPLRHCLRACRFGRALPGPGLRVSHGHRRGRFTCWAARHPHTGLPRDRGARRK